jgi:hypothetical protein
MLSLSASQMNRTIKKKLDLLNSADRMEQHEAFLSIMAATDQPVTWAYDVWDRFVRQLTDPSNRQRAIAAQVLCNLAKSDPEHRILGDFDRLFEVTRDKRFVTARHALQSIWKVGAQGDHHLALVLKAFEKRFTECAKEKNRTLIRSDILKGMKRLHRDPGDARVERLAKRLLQLEEDRKYRKKYLLLWRRSDG